MSLLFDMLETAIDLVEYSYYLMERWFLKFTQELNRRMLKIQLRKPPPKPKVQLTRKTLMITVITLITFVLLVIRLIIWFTNNHILRQKTKFKPVPISGVKLSEGFFDSGSPSAESESEQISVEIQPDPVFPSALLRACRQTKPTSFEDAFYGDLKSHVLVNETYYSVVYIGGNTRGKYVIKIVPVEASQTGIGSEFHIAKELLKLRSGTTYSTEGFVRFLGGRCIRDKYPKELLAIQNQNADPKKADASHRPLLNYFMCGETFVLMRFSFSGTRLFEVAVDNMEQICSIVLQVIWSTAIAERAFQFEHRDLQMENILVRLTAEPLITYHYNNRPIVIRSCGAKVSIADFGFSRATVNNNDVYFDPKEFLTNVKFIEDRSCMGFDYMRGALGEDWSVFLPETNVMWTWELLMEIDNYLRSLNFDESSRGILVALRRELWEHESLAAFVENSKVLSNLQEDFD